MVVWLPESPEMAEVPSETHAVRVGDLLAFASHVNPTDTLKGLRDQTAPKDSNDHDIPRMTWWDHRGTKEWLAYRFDKPRTVSGCEVYWFDDTGRGYCRVPEAWRLLYRDGDAWKPVELPDKATFGIAKDRYNRIRFAPVTTKELRLEVDLQPGFSGGVLRWKIEPTANP
jgi:hypothetical protein